MTLPDIIMLADYQAAKGKAIAEQEAILDAAQDEAFMFAIRQEFVRKIFEERPALKARARVREGE